MDFIQNVNAFIADLEDNRERESIIIAREAAALVRNRVQNDKLDSEGSSFGGYSKAVVPKWMLYDKSLSQGADDIIRGGEYWQSYEDLKEANGMPLEKNFTFTGEMWRNIGPVGVENSQNETSVYVGGQTERAADILRYQEPLSGNIIELNEQEIQFITEAHAERINESLSKYFG